MWADPGSSPLFSFGWELDCGGGGGSTGTELQGPALPAFPVLKLRCSPRLAAGESTVASPTGRSPPSTGTWASLGASPRGAEDEEGPGTGADTSRSSSSTFMGSEGVVMLSFPSSRTVRASCVVGLDVGLYQNARRHARRDMFVGSHSSHCAQEQGTPSSALGIFSCGGASGSQGEQVPSDLRACLCAGTRR